MPPRWSAADDQILRERYAANAPLREISLHVGRSEDAVNERRRTLGIPARRAPRPWTADEDALLRAAAAAGLPTSALAPRLRRPVDQVRRRRRELLGSQRPGRSYRPDEDAAIRRVWSTGEGIDSLALELGRSAGALRLRAEALGVHRPVPRRRWTSPEDAALRDGYTLGLTCAEIARTLPKRSATAVAARAAKLGLPTYARAWSQLDDRRLRRLINDGVAVESAAQLLSRTPEALRSRTRKLGLSFPSSTDRRAAGRPWTAEEETLLVLHGGLNPAVLAEILGRSPEAIVQRLRQRGLRDGRHRSPHHAVPRHRGATPGELAAIARELRHAGPGRRLALLRRIDVDARLIPAVPKRLPA
jgi:hypothetical protein